MHDEQHRRPPFNILTILAKFHLWRNYPCSENDIDRLNMMILHWNEWIQTEQTLEDDRAESEDLSFTPTKTCKIIFNSIKAFVIINNRIQGTYYVQNRIRQRNLLQFIKLSQSWLFMCIFWPSWMANNMLKARKQMTKMPSIEYKSEECLKKFMVNFSKKVALRRIDEKYDLYNGIKYFEQSRKKA